MCGLVGTAGEPVYPLGKAFNELLIIDVLRGPHSTGAALIDKKGENTIVKGAVLPHFLLYGKDTAPVFDKPDIMVRMGHNRHATIGDISNENAHPFHHGDTILAHNGTVSDFLLSNIRKGAPKQYATDSETICEAVDRLGIDEVWPEITYSTGAAALTIYNTKTNTLRFIRDNNRPLSFAFTNKRKGLLWASEPEFLDFALTRRVDLSVDNNEIYNLTPDRLYSFTWSHNHIDMSYRDIKRLVTIHRRNSVFARNYGGINWDDDDYPTSPSNKEPSKVTPIPTVKPDVERGHPPSESGKSLSTFMLAHEQCAFCDASLTEIDYTNGLLMDQVVACASCVIEAFGNGTDK